MKMTRVLSLMALLSLLVAGAAGCQDHQLFSGTDSYRRSNIDKYYERDSAVETRAARFRAADTGFGYPSGMNNQ